MNNMSLYQVTSVTQETAIYDEGTANEFIVNTLVIESNYGSFRINLFGDEHQEVVFKEQINYDS
jgi:hypothetical protein